MTHKQARTALHIYNAHVLAWRTIRASESIGTLLLARYQLKGSGDDLVSFGLAVNVDSPESTARLLAEGR